MTDLIDALRNYDRLSRSHTNGSDGKAQDLLFDREKVTLRLTQITLNTNAINDSFYLNSTTNGRLDIDTLGDRRTTTATTTITINI